MSRTTKSACSEAATWIWDEVHVLPMQVHASMHGNGGCRADTTPTFEHDGVAREEARQF